MNVCLLGQYGRLNQSCKNLSQVCVLLFAEHQSSNFTGSELWLTCAYRGEQDGSGVFPPWCSCFISSFHMCLHGLATEEFLLRGPPSLRGKLFLISLC